MKKGKNTRRGFTQQNQIIINIGKNRTFDFFPLEGEGGRRSDERESKTKTFLMNLKRHPLTCPAGHPLPQGRGDTARAFTLIELLVVVLIIGVLAAVAVPQYQKATAKARGATVIPLIRALGQAQEKYFLENGIYADSFAKLDVPLPADWNQSCNFYNLSADCHSNGYWGIAIGTETALMGTLYLEALSGPYKGAGFYYMPNRKNIGEGFGCLEHFAFYSANSGFWCNKLWGTSFKRGGSSLSFFQ